MAHEIYQTEGVILERRNFGEAEKLYIILTEKFGKITAIAQGVRNIKSKLKFNLEPLGLVKLALVATGESWRITDAEKLKSFTGIVNNADKLLLYSRLVKLISRMLQGQEKNHNLWGQFLADITFLEKSDLSKNELSVFEAVTALRILHNLGYVDKEDLSSFINIKSLDSDVLTEAGKMRSKIVFAVNEAIKSSHL
jgi:DNA repair protein RecO (recombination protein O)